MNSILIEFKEINEDWDNEISNYPNDIYHFSGWIKASTVIDRGIPKGIVGSYNNKKILIPIIIRKINESYWDATSTYGYGGPIVDPTISIDEINRIFSEIQRYLFNHGCVSWFIRLHPILNLDWQVNIGYTVTHGPTLISDLSKSEEDHWSETQSRHRRGIKKALKAEITTKCEKFNESNIDIFMKIYEETMSNVKANDFYFFDRDYFKLLAEYLPDNLLLITAFQDNLAIATSIYTINESSKIMQYHLGGTLNNFRKLQPAKLITHVAREWGRNNNYKFLHLGGGLGAQLDSLYEYKKGFSSYESLFKTHRIITNSAIYNQLVDNQSDTTNSDTDFFPLYRKQS